MKTQYHPSKSRGVANHGWLQSFHSFSFADYYNPDRMEFGALRVLNDDIIAGGMGFGMHPHRDMEILTIPLEGDIEHQDSMGQKAVIRQGEIQVMSAGTGIQHSEYNKNVDREAKLLQIWIKPNAKSVKPRYDQVKLKNSNANKLQLILAPTPHDGAVWIHQDAWFYLGEFDKDTSLNYTLYSKANGVYIFIIEGEANVESQTLKQRDALGLWETETVQMSIQPGAKVLVMEVPIQA